jgi:glycosyltransferase involved in cell wall biosynthesis
MTSRRLAILAATSGHSGVDRVLRNLIEQFSGWGLSVDLLRVRRHGPVLVRPSRGVRVVDLGTSHVTSSLPGLIRYLREERPDGLLCDKDRVNRIAILARALAGVDTKLAVRLGTTVSANLAGRGRWERWLQRTSMRHLYPLADAVIVPSQGAADDLAEYSRLPRERITVVRSPIVTTALRQRALEPLDHPWFQDRRVPVILGAGELGYRKDFETLVRAFARVRRLRPCRLVILGRGRRRDALLQLGKDLGVSSDLDLPGFSANPYAYMDRARLFALSSRWEGMPVVLIEALATHTPVVATDCPSGPREILGEHPVGTLVPVADSIAFADALLEWLDRSPPAEAFEEAISDYRSEASALQYLACMGLEFRQPPVVPH